MNPAALQPCAFRRAPLAALAALWLACAAAWAAEPVPAESVQGPPAPGQAPPGEEPVEYHCDKPGSDGQAVLDKVQRGVYLSVCGTGRWFDGLFGTRRYDQDSDETFGRLQLGESWDDRNGFDDRLKLRVRMALPTAEKRLKLLFGRVDERETESESESQSDAGTRLPSSFTNVEDDSWLLGLGYSKQGKLKNGFDFSSGVRIRTPVEPYAKGTYRHDLVFGDDALLRVRQTVGWRDGRGWGETTELSVDKLLSPRLLLRWSNSASLNEGVRRLEWYSVVTTFQSLGNRSGLAYSGFVNGVINTDVPMRSFGAELRFRRRILRKWLFLELRSSVSWPKESLTEERKINPGAGIGLEMYFGPVPDADMR